MPPLLRSGGGLGRGCEKLRSGGIHNELPIHLARMTLSDKSNHHSLLTYTTSAQVYVNRKTTTEVYKPPNCLLPRGRGVGVKAADNPRNDNQTAQQRPIQALRTSKSRPKNKKPCLTTSSPTTSPHPSAYKKSTNASAKKPSPYKTAHSSTMQAQANSNTSGKN